MTMTPATHIHEDSTMHAGMEDLIAVMKDRSPAPEVHSGLDSTALPYVGSEADDANAAAPRDVTAGLERGALVGRYVVLQRLGAGAMGVVVAAYDPELDRKVAIKLLLPGVGGASGRTRLLREAQTLAKLSHPNVVAIHDVGTMGAQVWLAMELVEGETLRQWLATPRSWREVVTVMRSAGEGLAAAHAAALLHRDLKPDNVMIGDDGRVHVMDFGLARGRARETIDPESSTIVPTLATLALEVTRADETPGTPAYMPPEQFDGKELTAAVDQFAFCVTLWEALCGERPFAGKSRERILVEIMAGRLRPVPKGRRIPAWLLRACTRGLAADPSRRWPSMPALLDALAMGRTRDRMRKGLAALGVVVLCGAGVEGYRRHDLAQRTAACEASGDEIADAWNPEREQALREGLLATGASYAATTAERTVPWLERQAEAWRVARVDACLDAKVYGAWDAEVLDRSLWCLDERRTELQTLVDELTAADGEVVSEAVLAAASLRDLAPCRDRAALAAQVPPRSEQQRESVRAIRADMMVVDNLFRTRSSERGLVLARSVLARAQDAQWPVLVAAARRRLGLLTHLSGDYAQAEASLEAAYFEAADANATELMFETALELVQIVGNDLGRHADGLRWGRHAQVALAALPEDDGMRRSQLLGNLGNVHAGAGDYASAEDLDLQSIAIVEDALGPDNPRVARPILGLGGIYESTGDYERAAAAFERAIALEERAFGPDHPETAKSVASLVNLLSITGDYERALQLQLRVISFVEPTLGPDHPELARHLGNLGNLYWRVGDYERAKAAAEGTLAILERRLGPDGLDVATALNNLASIHTIIGDYERARPLFERALEIRERQLDSDHPDLAVGVANYAGMLVLTGDYERAKTLFERALAAQERTLGPEHDDVATSIANLAEIHAHLGDLERAKTLYERALAIREKALGPDHPRVTQMLLGLAEIALAQRRPADALMLAQRATTVQEHHEAGADELARARFVLARTLWDAPEDAGRNRTRAMTLAEQARDAQREAGKAGAEPLAAIEAWLAERRSDSRG